MGHPEAGGIVMDNHRSWLQRICHYAVYALLVGMPLAVYWPLMPIAVPGILPRYTTPGLFLQDVPSAILLVTSLMMGWKRKTPRAIGVQWLAVLVLAIAGIPFAMAPPLAVYTISRWLFSLVLGMALFQQDLPLERMIKWFLAGLAVHVVVGITQALTQAPIGLPAEMALGLKQPGVAGIKLTSGWWLRAYGLTFHPNVLGGFLGIGLIAGLPLVKQLRWRFVWWLMMLGLLISFSRSAWLAVALFLPLVAVWLWLNHEILRKPLQWTFGVAVLTGLLAGVIFLAPILARFKIHELRSEETSLSGRSELIAVAFEVISARPITGIGAGNTPLVVQAAHVDDASHAIHNLPLLFAAEIGVLGGFLWLGLWLSPALTIKEKAFKEDTWAVALVGAWSALGFIGLWDSYPWALNEGRLLMMFLGAVTFRRIGNGIDVGPRRDSP